MSLYRYLAFLILTASLAFGQMSSSQITGTVSDSSGASIPGARVVLANEATGVTASQTTNASGVYVFPALNVGSYSITVEATGFKKERKTGEQLVVGTPLNVDFKMEVGQAAETVEVQDHTEALQTTNASMGDLVSHETLSKMPLNGRNAQNLAILQPGAVQTTGGLTIVNGMRNGAVNITVDGIDANESTNPNTNTNLYGLSPDNVQEFKATTSNPTSEEGRNSGINMSMATRSGTNRFHGSAYEFFRNTVLNANDFYANARGTSKPTLESNQYGFEIGGPVRRNKTFFFFNYEGQDINNAVPITASYGTVYLYTPQAVAGNFRYFVANPNSPLVISGQKITGNSPLLVNPQTGALASGVRNCNSPTDAGCVQTFNIPASDPQHIGLDPTIAKQLNSYPAPNGFSGGGSTDGLNIGNYFWNSPYYIRGPHYTGRVDHTIDSNNTVFVRYMYAVNNTLNGDPQNSRPQVLPGQPPLGNVERNGGSGVISYRHVFSPTIVNELTAGVSRWHFLFTQGQANPLWPNIPAYTFNLPTTPYLNNPETERGVTTPQVLDNLNIVKGQHIIRTGFNFRFYRHNDIRGQPGGSQVTPTISLSGSLRTPTGFGLPSLSTATAAGISSVDLGHLNSAINDVLGIPATITQHFLGNLNTNTYLPFQSNGIVTLFDEGQRIKQYDSFIQDEWKIRPDLTLNYGVRWEVNMAPTEAGGRVYVPNRPIDGSQGPVTFVHADSWYKNNNLDAFAPRIGLAWQPFGSRTTVIRAGYGISFDTINTFQVTAVAGNVPGIVTTCTTTVSTGATTAGCGTAPNLRISQGFPQQLSSPTVQPSSFLTLPAQIRTNAPNVITFDPNLKLPTVHQWNLAIQRELPKGFIFQVGYVGHRGTRLLRAYDINQINSGSILPSFLNMQQNVAHKCSADGSGCPAGVAGIPVPIVTQGIVSAATVNGATFSTYLAQNAAGSMAAQIENTTLAAHLRPNQQFATSTYLDSGGDSYYHALQMLIRKRFDNGLMVNASYSFSRAIDDLSTDPVGSSSGGGLSATGASTPIDISNWRLDRGISDYNRKHVFIGNWIYELPVGRKKRFLSSMPKALDEVIGGWALNGIMTIESGQPFSVLSGALTANGTHDSYAVPSGTSLPTPQLQKLSGVVGPVLFPSAAGFAIPAPGSDGLGRNSFYGPKLWNIDSSVTKTFHINERFKLVFRAEVFNLFNHINFNTGDLNILSSTFGQNVTEVATGGTRNVVLSGEPNRVMQMALRLTF